MSATSLGANPRVASPSRVVLEFLSPRQAAAALTARVVSDLEAAIALRGQASLAVPGGTTPAAFLRLLGGRSLDWRRITVTLTDERWVSPDHERSNERLITHTLGANRQPYGWRPLFRHGLTPEQAVDQLEQQAGSLNWPLDVVVLGMGEDGHVASLFPGRTSWRAADGRFVAATDPEGQPRVSLSMPALREARSLYLLFSGTSKRAVLERAEFADLPVAQALRGRETPAIVMTSP